MDIKDKLNIYINENLKKQGMFSFKKARYEFERTCSCSGDSLCDLKDESPAFSKEELNLETDLKLKNIVEMFLDSSKTKYHEIGFYYLSTIKENEVKNNFKSLDGDGIFEWTSVSDLENHKILAKPIKDKIVKNEIKNDNLEHLIYSEYKK